jgi:hypothetical protein
VKWLVGSVLVIGTGCAIRQPAPVTYRLIARNSDAVLVPPGVADAGVEQGTFITTVGVRSCMASTSGPITIQVRGTRARVIVRRDELLKEPEGWLGKWAAGLSDRGCITPGDEWTLANEVAESVPMDPRAVFRLLYGEAVDMGPQIRIQVDSPLFRDASGANLFATGPIQVTDVPGGVHIGLKSGGELVGFERAWYRLEAKPQADGLRIIAMSAERRVNGANEQQAQPASNAFSFAAGAGYYRLVYKQEQTEFTALVVAGRTRAELDEYAGKLSTRAANCGLVESGFCVAIPKGVAANLFVPVTVNGKEQLVHWGGTVGDTLSMASRERATVMPTLAISRLHNGKPAAIEFDRTSTAILGLRLVGGETISWK